MQDTCTIRQPSTRGPLDPTTKQHAEVPGAVVYTGQCRVKPAAGNQDRVVEAGEQPVSLWPFTVSVPMTAVGLGVDQVVTIDTSALDPELPGTRLRIKQVALGTHLTARRLGCEVNAG